MTNTIAELKNDHQWLVETLGKVSKLGISTEEGQKLLLSTKAGLLNHLKKEDRVLYPALREAAKKDQNLRRRLELFAKDMDLISRMAMDFFNKYSSGGSGIEFARDFGRLYTVLGTRIKKEEDILYAEFEKLNRQQ